MHLIDVSAIFKFFWESNIYIYIYGTIVNVTVRRKISRPENHLQDGKKTARRDKKDDDGGRGNIKLALHSQYIRDDFVDRYIYWYTIPPFIDGLFFMYLVFFSLSQSPAQHRRWDKS